MSIAFLFSSYDMMLMKSKTPDTCRESMDHLNMRDRSIDKPGYTCTGKDVALG